MASLRSSSMSRQRCLRGERNDILHARAGLLFAVVKVSPDDLPRVLPPRDGGYLTERMRQALLGRDDASEA